MGFKAPSHCTSPSNSPWKTHGMELLLLWRAGLLRKATTAAFTVLIIPQRAEEGIRDKVNRKPRQISVCLQDMWIPSFLKLCAASPPESQFLYSTFLLKWAALSIPASRAVYSDPPPLDLNILENDHRKKLNWQFWGKKEKVVRGISHVCNQDGTALIILRGGTGQQSLCLPWR